MDSACQWNGFVCPDCRLVFRVPSGNEGSGIVCSNCKRLLKIPGPDDAPPVLTLPKVKLQKFADGANAGDVPMVAKQRRRHSKSKDHDLEDHSWESDANVPQKREGDQSSKGLMFGLATLGLLLALGGILLFLKSDKTPAVLAEKKVPTPPVAVRKSDEKNQLNAEVEAAKAEPLVRKFLSAESVDEILSLVRNPKIAESRVKNFYPEGKIEPFDISVYNIPGTADSRDEFVSIYVRDRNYKEQAIVLVATPEGYKIDWESWVGWSEMSAKEFMMKKPAEPHVFRVTLSEVKYYNFDFKDDSKWTSYRIEFPNNEESSIYGYVEKSSILDQRIKLQKDEKKAMVMLSLKYPPNAIGNNQVLVQDLLHRGWVEGMKIE
jgi:hypothetical protein